MKSNTPFLSQPDSSKFNRIHAAGNASSGQLRTSNICISLADIIDDSLAVILAQGKLAQNGDATAVHQVRIELARLRAVFRFFDAFISILLPASLDQNLRWLAKRLGRARDVDVALALRKPSAVELILWNKERFVRYQGLKRTLNSPKYKTLLAQLQRISKRLKYDRSNKSDNSNELLNRRLGKWTKKISAYRKSLNRLSDQKLHRVRMRAKRLRYISELDWVLVPPKPKDISKQIAKAAKIIQQSLGKFHDAQLYLQKPKRRKTAALPRLQDDRQKTIRVQLLKAADGALKDLHRLQKKIDFSTP